MSPKKLSDKSKNKPERSYKNRRVNTRETRQRFLIVSQGEKTEPNYFETFQTLIKSVVDIEGLQQFLDNCLLPNSFEDENREFFREVAALKGQSVEETLDEMMAGRKNYLEAVKTSIEFKNGIPTDINKYVEN